ncbi:hypothetical protein Scep_006921 [Stephania cephalantha]|uniref:Uncharacterized protein n=1 Tax=Stephania cephalantha TaxID=152367 RepID=A0AAP0PMP7_9MAGN
MFPSSKTPSRLYNLYTYDVSCAGPLIKNLSDMVFGIIYDDKKLAFIRLGDKAWTLIKLDILHPRK